jgi:hypothetical protein
MSDVQRVYRAHIHWDYQGANVFCHYGNLSHDGEWVEAGDTRWRATADWFRTEAEAKASKAGEIAAMGAKLIALSKQLLDAAVAGEAIQ